LAIALAALRARAPQLLTLAVALLVALPAAAQDESASEPAPAAEVAPASPPEPEDPEAAWARWTTELAPQWAARRDSAVARVDLARAFTAGQVRLDLAYPALADAPLGSPTWLARRLADLDDAALARVQERSLPLPPFADEDRTVAAAARRAEAWAAESEHDQAERSTLLLLRALATDHVAFQESELDAVRAALGRQAGTADAAFLLAAEADKPAALARAVGLQDLAARFHEIVAVTRRAAILGTAPDLPPAATTALQDGSASPLEAAVATLQFVATDDPALGAALSAWRAAVQAAEVGPLPRDLVEAGQLQALSTRRLAEEEKRKANEAAEESRRQAEEARREASDVRSHRVAEVLERAAEAQAQAQRQWETTEQEIVDREQLREGIDQRLDQVAGHYRAVLQMAALDPARSHTAEDAWVELRDLIRELRREALRARGEALEDEQLRAEGLARVASQRAEVLSANALTEQFADGELPGDLSGAVAGWTAALDRQVEALTLLDRAHAEHASGILTRLQRAKEDRRRYRGITPRAVIARDRDAMLSDAQVEVSLLLPNLRQILAGRVAQAQGLRDSGRTWATISAAAVSSFWVVAGFLVWWWLRSGVQGWVSPAAERAARRSGGLLPADFGPFEASAVKVGRALTDLVALTLLIAPTRLRLPELAALLILARLVALYKMLSGLVNLAVAPRDEGRPAFFRLGRASWKRAQRSVRALLLLALASAFAEFLAINLLGTEALGALAGLVFGWLLAATLLVQLWRVEPTIRAATAAGPDTSGLRGWIANPRGTPTLTRPVRSALGICWLAGHRGWQLLRGSARDGTWIGSLVGIVERRGKDSGATASAAEAALPPGLRHRLIEAAVKADLGAPSDLPDRAHECFGRWRDNTDARGLIAVIGYPGQGKGRWARAWATSAAESTADSAADSTADSTADRERRDMGSKVLSVPNRVLNEAALLSWLGTELDCPPTAPAVLESLMERPPTVFVVEDLEFAFLRQVGGFSAVQALLDISGQTDRRHFWLFTAHAPAWRYLARLRRVLNPDAFQAVLELPRRSGAALREALFAAVEEAGCRLYLGGLVRPGTVSGDPEGDRERATVAYFRLLAEASQGNPGVATQLFLGCLRALPEGKTLYLTGVDRLLEMGEASLSDVQQLIGAALDVHVSLNAQEVAEVANLPLGAVRPALRLLGDREVVVPDGEHRYRLSLAAMPGVVQTLKRRHFVYGRS